MRRVAVALVWLAAIILIVIAIGLRVRARRLADPLQALRAYLVDVPPDLARIATVTRRDGHGMELEIRANARWLRVLATRNGFAPVTGSLGGMAAERWMLDDQQRGALIYLLIPLDGSPGQLTISE